jgi:hypothetical protein
MCINFRITKGRLMTELTINFLPDASDANQLSDSHLIEHLLTSTFDKIGQEKQ